MKNLLKNANQQNKQYLIDELIKLGVFKKNNQQLYECTLSDLQEEYNSMMQMMWVQSEVSNGNQSNHMEE